MAGSTNFPTGLDSYTDLIDLTNDALADDINNPRSALMAVETKVGVDSSVVATSLDYLLKNASSVNPGHKHTQSQTALLPVEWSEDGVSPPSAAEPLTINSRTVRIRKFQGTTLDQDCTFAWQAPLNFSGTTIKARIIFFISEATGPSAEGVVFTISCFSLGDGDSLDGTYGTAIISEKTGITASQYYREATAWSADISTLIAGETIIFNVARTQSHVDDTYGQSVGVFALELKYTESGIG